MLINRQEVVFVSTSKKAVDILNNLFDQATKNNTTKVFGFENGLDNFLLSLVLTLGDRDLLNKLMVFDNNYACDIKEYEELEPVKSNDVTLYPFKVTLVEINDDYYGRFFKPISGSLLNSITEYTENKLKELGEECIFVEKYVLYEDRGNAHINTDNDHLFFKDRFRLEAVVYDKNSATREELICYKFTASTEEELLQKLNSKVDGANFTTIHTVERELLEKMYKMYDKENFNILVDFIVFERGYYV